MNTQEFTDLGLIKKIAWSFHTTTGIELNELICEASLLYCKALKTYDPSRGKLSTHVWWFIRDELRTFVKEEREYSHMFPSLEIAWSKHTSPTPFYDALTSEAYEIAKTILRSSKKYVCLTSSQVEERIITIFLRKGWSEERIQRGLNDLKIALQ